MECSWSTPLSDPAIGCWSAQRALGIRVPGPPRNVTGDGDEWLPGTVERVREDGWVIVSLDADLVFDEAARRVAAPADAVQPLDQ